MAFFTAYLRVAAGGAAPSATQAPHA